MLEILEIEYSSRHLGIFQNSCIWRILEKMQIFSILLKNIPIV